MRAESPLLGFDGTEITVLHHAENSWQHDSGVSVGNKISPDRLTALSVDPIIDTDVEGIGEITLKKIRTTDGRRGQPPRDHLLYSLEYNHYRHAIEITNPASGDAKFAVVSMPGFTEQIEGPIRKDLHASMARAMPQARIISIGSNGVGSTGDTYGWSERSQHGLAAMGSQRLTLSRALAGDLPVIMAGTSMGSVIAHRAAFENTYGKPVNGKINLVGQYLLSQALVDPRHVVQDIGIKFLPQMAYDAVTELALKTNPIETAHIVGQVILHYGYSPQRDTKAMGNQVLELLKGTREEDIAAVIEVVPTVIVAGEKDCLAQWKMVRRLEKQYPKMLDAHMVMGRGHSLGMKPARACSKLVRAGQPLIEKALAGTKINGTLAA